MYYSYNLINQMVYLYSIVSGFRAVLGSVAIQVAMAACLLLFVSAPETPFVNEPYPGANEELAERLETLNLMTTLTHLFCAACIAGSQFTPEKQFVTVQVIMIFSMMCQILNLTFICDYLFLESETNVEMT
jgi:hypothetical protein